MKKKFVLLFLFLFLGFAVLAGLRFEKDHIIVTYDDRSGGLNLFSSPSHGKDNQALNLENFLFQGTQLRARKGISNVNTTSLGGYGVNATFLYDKPSALSQIIACYSGKLYYMDPDSTDFNHYITDRTFTVTVANNDSIVKGSGTFFTLLGYADSIEVLINDTTHYIYKIHTDTMLALYSQWKGGDSDAATLTQPFYVDATTPTQIEMWVDNLFVMGSEKMAEWDGNTLTGDLGDTTSFKITGLEVATCCNIKITVTPTFTSEGYDYGDLVGYYIYAYNDTTTDTAQTERDQPIFNKPLQINIQGSDYIYVWADSFWVADQTNEEGRHLDTNSLFKIMPRPSSEKLVFAGVIDSLVELGNEGQIDTCDNGATCTCVQWINAYDSSQTWLEHDLDFGIFELREMKTPITTQTVRRSNIFLRQDDNGVVYLYAFYEGCTNWAQGDSFEIYRLYSSSMQDVPKYMAHWQDRQWVAGYADKATYLCWSEPFYSVADSFISSRFVYVEKDDGDIITALEVMPFQDYLLVFKKKHIYAITGEAPLDFTVNDVTDNIGTPSWASIISYGRQIYFYDYTGFYVLDGVNPYKISWAIEPIVADSINKDYAHLIVGGYFDNHMWWSYPSGSATKNNRTVVYNLETQAWAKIDQPISAIYVGQVETDDYGVLWGDPDSGRVYQYGQSYFDNGVANSAIFESGWLDLQDPYDFEKKFKDIQFLFDKHDSSIIYITYYKDYNSSSFSADTVDIDDSDIFQYWKRPIRGDNVGQRIKVKFEVTRIDKTTQIPFFKIKYKPTGETFYDD